MTLKILITGASGFLGSRAKIYFIKRGFQVLSPSHRELDLLHEESVSQYIKHAAPDYLIHCAAISDTGYCQAHEDESYAMNVKAAESIAKACQRAGTKLIFCSSDQIYFGSVSSPVPHTEDESVTPLNLYGQHKLMAEKICTRLCPASVILRLTWMYDTRQIAAKEHGNFYSNLKSSLERGDICSFPVHDYRGITYVWAAVENLEKTFTLPGGVYNFGAGNPYTTYDTVRQLFDKKGIASERLVPNAEAFRDNPRNISMNTDKLRAQGITFDDTLPMLIKYWQPAAYAKTENGND